MGFTCIELFAGAGGASMGIRQAGGQSVLQVEYDADACATLRAAGFEHVVEADVRVVSFDGVPQVDLLWASPPCQGWSQLGSKLGIADTRNGWPWTIEAIDRMRSLGNCPTWVSCENVVGLTMHATESGCGNGVTPKPDTCRGCYWREVVVRGFEQRFAWVGTVRMDAADYGAPQRRERVFLVAGPEEVAWPKPTHSRRALIHAKWVAKSYWARHGIPEDPAGPSGEELKEFDRSLWQPLQEEPWRTVRDVCPHLTHAIRVEIQGAVARSVDEAAPAMTGRGIMYTNPCVGEVCGKATQVRLMRESEPVPEVDPDDWMAVLAAYSRPRTGDATYRRRLTPEESAAIQAFPGGYPFQGGSTSQFRQIGNAVPPPLARALVSAVMRVSSS